MKKYLWIFGILCMAFYFFSLKKSKCFNSENKEIKIIRTCFIVPDFIYNRFNYFCDSHSHWIQVATHIKRLNQFKTSDKSRFHRHLYWGVKLLECGDNSDYDDFNDSDVFLYTIQDTTLSLYDGALVKIRFGRDIFSSDSDVTRDIGEENRKIEYNMTDINVDYLINHAGVNIDVLRKFQSYISYDNKYKKKFKNSNYRLINKKTNQCIASIKYKEYGKRFYFDVYSIIKDKKLVL